MFNIDKQQKKNCYVREGTDKTATARDIVNYLSLETQTVREKRRHCFIGLARRPTRFFFSPPTRVGLAKQLPPVPQPYLCFVDNKWATKSDCSDQETAHQTR